jgi:hypothetical protein
MEKINVTPATSAYASWQTEEPLVELPTDEINVEKAEEVTKAIEESGITFGETTLTHLDGTKEPITVYPYPAEAGGLVQQSMSALKELTNNPEVQKALESEGLTVDFSKVNQTWNDGTGFGVGLETGATIRPLTDEEAEAVTSGGTCACTDCIEETDSDVDTDTMLIVHDLSERLAALEARIAEYNTKASHKI